MLLIFPLAVRAAEILGADAAVRPMWREIAANLPTIPQGGRGGGSGGFGGFIFGNSTEGAIEPLGADRELKARFLNFNRTSGFIDVAGIGGAQIFRNRLRLREGPGAIDAEHIGGLASGIHSSLLVNTAAVAEDPLLQVFPAWPSDWDSEFTLLAPGAFTVTASMRHGKVEFVELQSSAGASCRLHNPWGDAGVSIYRNGRKAEDVQGPVLSIPTAKGERIVVVPRGTAPAEFRRTL